MGLTQYGILIPHNYTLKVKFTFSSAQIPWNHIILKPMYSFGKLVKIKISSNEFCL